MGRFPTENIDYTSRDYEAFRDLLIQELQINMPEYTDTSETDAGIVILEALANGLDILSLYLDVTANDVILPTTQDRNIAILLANCLGYSPYNQTASEYLQVFELEETQDTDFVISAGTMIMTVEDNSYTQVPFELQEDLIIPPNKIGNEKDESGNYLYSVKIKQGETIEDDILGSSSGSPLQTFNLSYTEVLVDSIQLYVNEGDGKVLWEQVENFIDADENSRVYTVSVDDFDVCTIHFGSGTRGKIPSVFSNGISATYRIGGGETGNVSLNTITDLDEPIIGVNKTYNVKILKYGHEKESLESIKLNAPASFRTRDRLVTLQDYADLLRINFNEFLDVVAVRDNTDHKKANIYYMLDPVYKDIEQEHLTDLLDKVKNYVNLRSMLGTSCALHPYEAQPLNITLELIIDKDYNVEEIKEDVEDYLDSVIFKYGELTFNDYIIKSDIESELKSSIEGLISVGTNLSSFTAPTQPYNVLTKGTINITSRVV